LGFCRFRYRNVVLPVGGPPGWLPAWTNTQLLPTGIRVGMTPLIVDPARVPLETVTVPIRVTKLVLAPYPDELPQ